MSTSINLFGPHKLKRVNHDLKDSSCPEYASVKIESGKGTDTTLFFENLEEILTITIAIQDEVHRIKQDEMDKSLINAGGIPEKTVTFNGIQPT